MSLGNKVAAIEQLRLRLVTGISSGHPLESAKRIRVGSIEEARKAVDFPTINIDLITGDETNYYSQHGKVDDMDVEISLICNKMATEYNSLYLITAGVASGPLYLLEQLLNVLDKTTAGVVDIGLSSTANQPLKYTYELKPSSTFIEFVIKVKIQTAQFTAGAR